MNNRQNHTITTDAEHWKKLLLLSMRLNKSVSAVIDELADTKYADEFPDGSSVANLVLQQKT